MNTINIKGRKFSVEQFETDYSKERGYKIYKLTGSRAVYYTSRYVNHPGYYFILDSRCKISNVYKNVDLVEQLMNHLRLYNEVKMEILRFKICTYPSGRQKCYVFREKKINEIKTISHWAVTSLDAPEFCRLRGSKFEVEYQFKNPGDKFK